MTARAYTAADLAVLVPTKDRPLKLAALLESLFLQRDRIGRIIVVDGAESADHIVRQYADRLPVERHPCTPAGQLRQRNLGISLLDDRTPLVACLDDDIVLEPDAVPAMITFWNRCDAETAGVGFNIVNTPPEPRTRLRALFLMCGSAPGQVLRSGMATSNCQVEADLRTQWLCGGATVWRLEILKRYGHEEIASQWAIGEDVIFSYPIGKHHPLYVCATARVRHEHVFDYKVGRPLRFHGRTRALWMLYFVEANRDLSRTAFLWMTLGAVLGRLGAAAWQRNRGHLEFAMGQIQGVMTGLGAVIRGVDMTTVLRNEATR